MGLALGLLACLGLWWLSKNPGRLGRALTPRLARRLGAWGAMALAAILLLRGQLAPALVLGLGGVWLLEGPQHLGRRLRTFLSVPKALRRGGAPTIVWETGRDGTPDGSVVAGPLAGRRIGDLAPSDLAALLRLCRGRDPAGAALLEAYLDRRLPGWRVDAQPDEDARPRRPPQPGAMTQDEAYEILGLERGAAPEAVRTAHRTLMKQAHPDQGGSAERAARVNAARDRLMDRHR